MRSFSKRVKDEQMVGEMKRIGIVGAGTMGGGIAMAFANASLSVVLVDADRAALERGMQRIRSLYVEAVQRGKVDLDAAVQRLDRILPTTELSDVASCDIVIEAVFEDLGLKSRLAAQLGQVCDPHTVLASNTSSLDINVLAQASSRADRFVGMHFFSPAHIMRLVEVARGRNTSEEIIVRVVELVRALSKVPVVCGVCFGFIGNRMAEPYLREAESMLLEGATAAQIDAVAQSPEWLGMAMGPCRMMDLAGLDIGASIIAERASTTNLLADASYRSMVRALTAQGHLGQKSGRGFFRYEGRQPVEAPETVQLARELARQHGIEQRTDIQPEEILQRLLYPLINEGFEVLREGIASTSADIDTVFTAGFGFPAARGGPMTMANDIGLHKIRAHIEAFAQRRGDPHGYWTPSPLLIELSRVEEVAK
jgi:3-hydroxyacyl-CoA dehydrogenase